MLGLKRGIVKLSDHDAKWKKHFTNEKRRLLKVLGNLIIDIQHIGSTSIPKMPAKPIIDITGGLKSMKDSRKVVAPLKSLGYEYRKEFGGPKIHLLFAKGPKKRRTYYLHIVKYLGRIWNNDLLFRNYLREHPKEAKNYLALKKGLAKKFGGDRPSYTRAKAAFIHRILKKSKNERS